MPKQKGADRLGQRLSALKTITRGQFRLVENLLRAFRRFTSFQIIILGFAGVIVAGALLLMLPAASAAGAATPFTDALFTSTSAVCVTGLVVRDSGSYWSPFGQSLILLLIQIGGLGVITMSATFLMLAGRNISLKERSAMQDALSAPSVGGIVRLTRFILKGTFIVELTGALVMLPVFWRDHGFRGIWMAVFHSVSAFCNAGFDILGTNNNLYPSLTGYVKNPVINITVMLLIITGGIGFLTWDDICENKLHFHRYRMQSKVILVTTLTLIVLPALFFFFVDFDALPLGARVQAALFQSVTPRTAGFNTVDQILFRGIRMEALKIFAHGRIQNQRILRHISRLPAPRTKSFLRQRLAVHENLALLRKQEAQQQIDRRRLPRAVAAKQRQNLPAPK